MGAFDNLANLAVKTTSALMGYSATWVKDSTHTYTALVKYKDERGEAKVGDKTIPGVDSWWIEAKDSDFPGMKALIDSNKKPVISVTVRGEVLVFNAIKVDALSDGLCNKVYLRLKS